MALPRFYIVGLGNLPYPGTRHRHTNGHCSIGQYVLDALVDHYGLFYLPSKGGHLAETETTVGNIPCHLTFFKSSQLMNVSGPSIVNNYAVQRPQNMIVLVDSIRHAQAKLSAVVGGGPQGHNGTKSIIASMGRRGTDFWRFRLGVGNSGGGVADYVLDRMSSYEKGFWKNEGLDLVLKKLEEVVKKEVKAGK
ncbi:peptidyl-tRNA hydrolase [Cyathus striatus]|nr:peptidyl-tRNA hydrolase [Cyathus striatus]